MGTCANHDEFADVKRIDIAIVTRCWCMTYNASHQCFESAVGAVFGWSARGDGYPFTASAFDEFVDGFAVDAGRVDIRVLQRLFDGCVFLAPQRECSPLILSNPLQQRLQCIGCEIQLAESLYGDQFAKTVQVEYRQLLGITQNGRQFLGLLVKLERHADGHALGFGLLERLCW